MGKGRKKGRGKSRSSIFIGAWVDLPVATALDKVIRELDLDRSEFLRRALEEKLRRNRSD
jgi:hypothetical protein